MKENKELDWEVSLVSFLQTKKEDCPSKSEFLKLTWQLPSEFPTHFFPSWIFYYSNCL